MTGGEHPFDLFCRLLDNVITKTWGKARASCPVAGHTHGDDPGRGGSRSLVVDAEVTEEGDDTVLLYCESQGHSAADVCAALGQPMSAMYRKRGGTGRRKTRSHAAPKLTRTEQPTTGAVVCWLSHDHHGRTPTVVYECMTAKGEPIRHERYEFPEHGCAEKRMPWNPPGHSSSASERHYLPQPLSDDGEPTFLVEGEKVTDALAVAGFDVVGLAGGSSSPPTAGELQQILRGRKDIIGGPDLDVPGFKFARKVGEALRTTEGLDRVRYVEPDRARGPGSDLADVAFPGVDALTLHRWATGEVRPDPALVEAARERVLAIMDERLTEIIPHEDDLAFDSASDVYRGAGEPAWACRGVLVYGAMTQTGAEPKTGKTILAMHLVKAARGGGHFLGQEVDADVVIYLTEQADVSFREQMAMVGIPDDLSGLDIVPIIRKKSTWPDTIAMVERRIERRYVGKKVMVVVDTISKWAGLGEGQEQDSGALVAAFEPLEAMTTRLRTATLVLRHAKKASAEMTPSEAFRGSNAGAGVTDINLMLAHPPNRLAAGRRTRKLKGEGRFAAIPDELDIEWTEGGYVILEQGDESEVGRCVNTIPRVLAQSGRPMHPDELSEAAGTKPWITREALNILTTGPAPRVERIGAGVKGDRHLFRLIPEEGFAERQTPNAAPGTSSMHREPPSSGNDPSVAQAHRWGDATSPFLGDAVSRGRVVSVHEDAGQDGQSRPRTPSGSPRRPECVKDESQCRQHQSAWRRLPGTEDDWACGICDGQGATSATEARDSADARWGGRDGLDQASA